MLLWVEVKKCIHRRNSEQVLTGIKFQEGSNCALCCLLVSLVVVVSAGPNSTMSSYEHLTRLHTKCNVVHHSFLPPLSLSFSSEKAKKIQKIPGKSYYSDQENHGIYQGGIVQSLMCYHSILPSSSRRSLFL